MKKMKNVLSKFPSMIYINFIVEIKINLQLVKDILKHL